MKQITMQSSGYSQKYVPCLPFVSILLLTVFTVQNCSRHQTPRTPDAPKLDLKHFLNRPAEHLQKYPVLLDAIAKETAPENPDSEFLAEAIEAIKNLQSIAQLRIFQTAMGKGAPGKWEWHDIVPAEIIKEQFSKQEAKRQS